MSIQYIPGFIPAEYNQAVLIEELNKIARAIEQLETPAIIITPQNVEPDRPQDGMIAHADGTNWNPGHGSGLYEYHEDEWLPLFAPVQGIKTSQTVVQNTTTETEVYSTTIGAGALHAGDVSISHIGGSYDTGAASDTWTLRVKYNGTTVHTIARQSANNVTGAGWVLDIQASIRTEGVSGTMVDILMLSDDDATIAVSDTTTHTIDTTTDKTLSITVQWGAAKTANIFRCDHGIVKHHH